MSNASDSDSDSDVPTDSLRKNKRFSLEAHDKDSGPNQQHNRKVGDKDKGRVPLDSKIEKESDNFAPDVGFNLDFLDEMKAEDVSASTMSHSRSEMPSREPAANVYTRDRIYKAVMKGDAEDLDGLYQYLSSKLKKLTNEEFREPKNGKTCLLKAMLNLKDGKNDTIPLLLEVAEKTDNLEKLVNAAYRDPYYKGHTALHTAIEKRNLPYVELLMSKKANVQAQAEGEFFQKRERGVGFYFGELPLSLAACTNQPSIVHYLMDNPYSKADITARDSKGNTVLHALVMVADDTTENTHFVTKMYDEILLSSTRLCPTLRIEEETNYKELTPLQLAAKLGRIEIFKHILRREMKEPEYQHLSRKFTEWVYGPVACSLYDLTSVDTHKETSGKKSVVEIIAFESDSKNRHKMIVLEPINELLQRKWETFGRPIFYTKFLLHVLYMLIFTVVAYNRPLTGKPPFAAEKTAKGGFRFVGEILTMVGSVYLFISQP
ncbi:hypothetical protein NDU88_002746 [Pleurodeles waltl]|uniref:Transient receptor potential cation channel subfamily V member 1 n=1 Tax=Pleurodeles waltl TaxID=8319 RepID=A0AAV7UBS2_PLEWA|nr:hypothetical protein NDU88_002746 [Pleurodeles waltl]